MLVPFKAKKMKERVSGGEICDKRHERGSSHCEIPTDNSNDWPNIGPWCPSKTLMIESDDFTTESNRQKEINFIHDSKDTKKQIECSKFDTSDPNYKHDILVGKNPKEEFQEGNESTGDNQSLPNGDDMMREITQSININNKNDKFNGEKSKHTEIPKENEEQILQEEIRVKGKLNDYYEDDDEEEEYYIIEEEIIEDDENEEEINGEHEFNRTREKEYKIITGDDEYKRTGEDKKKKRRKERSEKQESELELKRGIKRKEYEVFVGGLNRRATKQDVYDVFSQTGDIQSIRMAFFPLSDLNKGYAFVRYATKEQAKLTLKELNFPLVRGKRCEVRASHENDILFLGHICKLWNKEHLKHKLKNYGITNYKELTLIEDSRNKGMNKGFAFLEFWSLPDAKRVYETLKKSRFVFGTPRSVKVSFARFDEHSKFNPEIMDKVTTVFIDEISPKWEEDYVRSCLKKYGIIKQIKLAKNMKRAKRLDFGYVTFDSHENAVKCIEGLNKKGFGRSGHHKVKVRAALSRPLIKPRPRPQIRSGAKSSFDRHISISPSPNRLPARISKRVSEGRFSPLVEREYKRIKTELPFENYERSEYGSNHIEERRYYRDEDYYSSDDYYRENSLQSYDREGRIRNFSKSARLMCQYEDDGHNMHDESNICRSKSRFDCDCKSFSQRHGRSHSAYRSSVSYKEDMYNNRHEDICYRDGSVCMDNIRASNNSRCYVGGGSDMFQGCPCCVKREHY